MELRGATARAHHGSRPARLGGDGLAGSDPGQDAPDLGVRHRPRRPEGPGHGPSWPGGRSSGRVDVEMEITEFQPRQRIAFSIDGPALEVRFDADDRAGVGRGQRDQARLPWPSRRPAPDGGPDAGSVQRDRRGPGPQPGPPGQGQSGATPAGAGKAAQDERQRGGARDQRQLRRGPGDRPVARRRRAAGRGGRPSRRVRQRKPRRPPAEAAQRPPRPHLLAGRLRPGHQRGVDQHGRIDALVCNTLRRGLSFETPIERIGSAEWDRHMAGYLSGPFYLVRAALDSDAGARVTAGSSSSSPSRAAGARSVRPPWACRRPGS